MRPPSRINLSAVQKPQSRADATAGPLIVASKREVKKKKKKKKRREPPPSRAPSAADTGRIIPKTCTNVSCSGAVVTAC